MIQRGKARTRLPTKPGGNLRGGGGVANAEEELEALFRAEYRGLVRALAVVAGDAESAADAVQDAFVQAFKHWPSIRRYDQPALWVRRAAVNKVMNQHRSRRRRDAAVDRLAIPPESVARDLDIGPAVAAFPSSSAWPWPSTTWPTYRSTRWRRP
jgi:DNA-directed RNA polymerase specialized sigma24 family protein